MKNVFMWFGLIANSIGMLFLAVPPHDHSGAYALFLFAIVFELAALNVPSNSDQ